MLAMIAAVAKNNVIGKDGKMPWHIPYDLKYFQAITRGNTVIMGRKTFESIGKPLPDRENVIITSDKHFHPDGVVVFHTIEDALHHSRQEDRPVFVIGGETLYRQFLPFADRLYLTRIEDDFEGDTFFPEIDIVEWQIKSWEPGILDEQNPYVYDFEVYDRERI